MRSMMPIVLAALIAAAPAIGQRPARSDSIVPLKVDGKTVTVIVGFPATVTAPAGYDFYLWDLPPGLKAKAMPGDDNVLAIDSAAEGQYDLSVMMVLKEYVFDKDGKAVLDDKGQPKINRKKDRGEITIAVGKLPAPGPGPGPGPDPKPPDPPPPVPAPMPADAGIRVLMVYDETKQKDMTAGQRAAIFGSRVREYLVAKAVMKTADGKQDAYRIWPQSVKPLDKVWADAMARPRTTLPWLVVSDGKSGYEGPLPGTVEETMAILQKYGK